MTNDIEIPIEFVILRSEIARVSKLATQIRLT